MFFFTDKIKSGDAGRRKREIDREIVRLSVPAIVSNITVPLLALSDTAISGHLGSAAYIGAMSVGGMMLNVAFWLFGFLRMGTTGLTSQAYGADDRKKCGTVLTMSFMIGVLVGLMLIMLRNPLSGLLLDVVGAEQEIRSLAREYYLLCIFGAPALLATMSINGWFVGMQSTMRAMIVSISVNIVNIAVSLWLVFGMNKGFMGVAYGTLASQWVGLAIALVMAGVMIRSRGVKVDWKRIFAGEGFGRFFKVNTDLFFRSGCIMIVSMSVTAAGARMGELTLATNAVMTQFFIFFSYFMDGFAFTGEALVGRFGGARDVEGMRLSISRLGVWSVCMACSFFLIYFCFLRQIAGFITDEREVVENIMRYRIWIYLLPPVTVWAFLFDGIYIGLTATRAMLYATLAASCLFFAVRFAGVELSPGHGVTFENMLLWMGFLGYLLTRGVWLWIRLPREMKIYLEK